MDNDKEQKKEWGYVGDLLGFLSVHFFELSELETIPLRLMKIVLIWCSSTVQLPARNAF